jgi:hypothetical protein
MKWRQIIRPSAGRKAPGSGKRRQAGDRADSSAHAALGSAGQRGIKYDIAISRRGRRPKLCHRRCPRLSRGRRESRVPMTPAVVRKNAHGGPQVRRNTRPSLRSGLRLMARSSRSRIPLASVADGLAIDRNPVGLDDLHRLDTSNGCRNHTLLPSAASPDRNSATGPYAAGSRFDRDV